MSNRFSMGSLTQAVSLQTRLIVGVVLLIVLCMGAAILATMGFGNRVAREAIDEALDQSQTVQARFVQLRLEQLESQAKWFARDPAIVSFFLEAVDSQSTVSLLDLLAEYQADVEFDVALVLDADGFLVVRTDQPEAESVDMASEPLVEIAFDEGVASGFWLDSKVLYAAVAVPLTQQFDLIGYLIMGQRLDDSVAAEVERLSSAQIAYLVEVDGGLETAATTLSGPEQSRLLSQIRFRGGLDSVLGTDGSVELMLGDESFEGLAAPLRDADNERLGATVALASRRERTRDLSRLVRVMWGVGLLSLLIGLGLAVLLSKRLLRPVRSLVDAAEAAREGNYHVAFEASGSDEVGRLSRSFEGLLAQLRAEQELQTFVGEVSRNLPEPGEVPADTGSVTLRMESVAVGAVDLRKAFIDDGSAVTAGAVPDTIVSRLEEDIGRVHQYCTLHGGQLVALLGHRLYVAFTGPDGPGRALVALSDALEAIADSNNAFRDARPAMGALTVGQLLVGPLRIGHRRQLSAAGPAVQQLDSLLREATPRDLVLSRRLSQLLGGDLVSAKVEIKERDALMSTQQHFLVDPAAVSKRFGPALRDSQAADVKTLVLGEDGVEASDGTLNSVPLLEPGSLVGDRYEILSILGMGGMGVVYKARDRELTDLVALKALKPSLVGSDTFGVDVIELLKSELKLARKVTHANVLRTHDFQVVDGQPFISMEYVRGITLREMLERSGQIPRAAALRLLQQLCAGLSAAHSQQVLHGDIKPENIILAPDGHAKLMDFGIARPLVSNKTADGPVLGTPYYMAPEQISGGPSDMRSDIYACGVVAYELLVGRLPFTGTTPKEVFVKHLQEAPLAPTSVVPDLPPWIEVVLLRCLAKEPAERFSTAVELRAALSHLA